LNLIFKMEKSAIRRGFVEETTEDEKMHMSVQEKPGGETSGGATESGRRFRTTRPHLRIACGGRGTS